MITMRKAHRAVKAACPGWLVIMWVACAFIPGYFDEVVPLAVTLVMLAAQPQRARQGASAWRGGKSHRAWDAVREAAL